jgi:uncharacterized cofD-like protein
MKDTSPLRVVSIGGGNGLSALLQGLKHFAQCAEPALPSLDITAIVTVTDDGGSSGRLRREFDVLPPGDIRNCMVALSEDSALLSRLFQYRFSSGRGLKGHSFGNLFLMALTQIMGDFPEAVRVSSEVLKIAGRIYPSTTANVALEAILADGTTVVGETRISRSRQRIERIHLIPRKVRPMAAALDAIAHADVITMGPGSLYTSVVPNLLVEGVAPAIRRSPAARAYFVNLMSQPGETTGFLASDHIRAIHRHAGRKFLDYAVVNIRPITSAVKKRYAREEAKPVENDIDAILKMGVKVLAGNLARRGDKVRHDPVATAAVVMRLAQETRRRINGQP